MAERLWEKGETVNELMHRLTVGNDPIIDRSLVCADVLGSAAHAKMLHKVGLLNGQDTDKLLAALAKILPLGKEDSFDIPAELEDVHTAIEARLIEECGEAGRRIHTGRSRNDQVLLATRLFLREQVVSQLGSLLQFLDVVQARWEEWRDIPMPGYTHLQPAMPSSVGMWLHAFYEATLELLRDGLHLLKVLNSNPLGSAAGFGVSLPQDRKYVAELLGFDRVQRSYIDVNNSRGRYEQRYLRWLSDMSHMFEKFACDVMLFSMEEFRFFSLPNELTTGSSIMPQKRNPDLVELLRGRVARIRAAEQEVQFVTSKLPSSYHRDLQYTKEPTVRGAKEGGDVLVTAILTMKGLIVNFGALEKALYPELYATYDAYREVKRGMPFREAYKVTAKRVKEGKLDLDALKGDFMTVQDRMKEDFSEAVSERKGIQGELESWQALLQRVETSVLEPVS